MRYSGQLATTDERDICFYSDIVQHIADDNGTSEQRTTFGKHLKVCSQCQQQLENVLKIKEIIKKRCNSVKAPDDLIQGIHKKLKDQ